MIRGYEPGKAYGRYDTRQYVTMWEQPFKWWLLAQIYHKWETLSWHPMRVIEKVHGRFADWSLDYIPLTNRQDIRCAHLREKHRKNLLTIYITEEQYNTITSTKE